MISTPIKETYKHINNFIYNSSDGYITVSPSLIDKDGSICRLPNNKKNCETVNYIIAGEDKYLYSAVYDGENVLFKKCEKLSSNELLKLLNDGEVRIIPDTYASIDDATKIVYMPPLMIAMSKAIEIMVLHPDKGPTAYFTKEYEASGVQFIEFEISHNDGMISDQYQAEEGMTWAEWIESEYYDESSLIYIDENDNSVLTDSTFSTSNIYTDSDLTNIVYASDIINNTIYYGASILGGGPGGF